jgi:hypothetical protein
MDQGQDEQVKPDPLPGLSNNGQHNGIVDAYVQA